MGHGGLNDLEARFGGVPLSATVLEYLTDIQATMDTKKRGLVSGNFNHIDRLAGPRQISSTTGAAVHLSTWLIYNLGWKPNSSDRNVRYVLQNENAALHETQEAGMFLTLLGYIH